MLYVSFRHAFMSLTNLMGIPNSMRKLYKTSLLSESFSLDSRMLDKILHVVDKSDMPVQLLQPVLSPFLQIATMKNKHC